IAAGASRTEKLLARRAVVASEHPSHESRKVAGAPERPQIPGPVPLRVRAGLDKAVNPLEEAAVDAAPPGKVGRRSAGDCRRHLRRLALFAKSQIPITDHRVNRVN